MRAISLVSIACLLWWLAIGLAQSASRGHAYLNVTLKNNTGEEIDEAEIVFGKLRCTSGILGKGASATYVEWQKPVETNAVVKWRDGKHVKKETTVDLTSTYNPALAGTLIFSINETNVAVCFQKR